jgi:hypothetical protein
MALELPSRRMDFFTEHAWIAPAISFASPQLKLPATAMADPQLLGMLPSLNLCNVSAWSPVANTYPDNKITLLSVSITIDFANLGD